MLIKLVQAINPLLHFFSLYTQTAWNIFCANSPVPHIIQETIGCWLDAGDYVSLRPSRDCCKMRNHSSIVMSTLTELLKSETGIFFTQSSIRSITLAQFLNGKLQRQVSLLTFLSDAILNIVGGLHHSYLSYMFADLPVQSLVYLTGNPVSD